MQRTNSKDDRLITATFKDRKSADRAYQSVVERKNYGEDDVTVLMSDETKNRHYGEGVEIKKGNKAAEGAGVGAAIGGTAGGIAGALAAVGSNLLVPGLGLVVAGPLAAALAGAGAGGGAGSIIGALVGAGIPEERAKRYEKDLNEGHIVLGVRPHSDEDARHFESSWRDHSGERIYSGTPSGTTQDQGYAAYDDDFRAHHRSTFGASDDYATYEPAYRFGYESAHDDHFHDRSFADAESDLKRRYNDRHPGGTWDKVKAAVKHAYHRARSRKNHRRHFSDTYGSDADFATYEPAYRFGHDMARDDRFRDRSYADAESDLKRLYTDRHPNSTWDRVKAAVKHAFSRRSTTAAAHH